MNGLTNPSPKNSPAASNRSKPTQGLAATSKPLKARSPVPSATALAIYVSYTQSTIRRSPFLSSPSSNAAMFTNKPAKLSLPFLWWPVCQSRVAAGRLGTVGGWRLAARLASPRNGRRSADSPDGGGRRGFALVCLAADGLTRLPNARMLRYVVHPQ
jgi:hypothetical protein